MQQQPLAGVQCNLVIEGKDAAAITDDGGLIELAIFLTDHDAHLSFSDTEVPFDGPIQIRIGHLDPVDTESGQVARLRNLAYFLGDPEDLDTPEATSRDQSRSVSNLSSNFHWFERRCSPLYASDPVGSACPHGQTHELIVEARQPGRLQQNGAST